MKPSSTWSRIIYLLTASTILFVIAMALSAQGDDPEMKVMRTGLGSGTIASADGRINCGADRRSRFDFRRMEWRLFRTVKHVWPIIDERRTLCQSEV
jgi:hypothetical protein